MTWSQLHPGSATSNIKAIIVFTCNILSLHKVSKAFFCSWNWVGNSSMASKVKETTSLISICGMLSKPSLSTHPLFVKLYKQAVHASCIVYVEWCSFISFVTNYTVKITLYVLICHKFKLNSSSSGDYINYVRPGAQSVVIRKRIQTVQAPLNIGVSFFIQFHSENDLINGSSTGNLKSQKNLSKKKLGIKGYKCYHCHSLCIFIQFLPLLLFIFLFTFIHNFPSVPKRNILFYRKNYIFISCYIDCPKSNEKNLRTATQCYLSEWNQNERVECSTPTKWG